MGEETENESDSRIIEREYWLRGGIKRLSQTKRHMTDNKKRIIKESKTGLHTIWVCALLIGGGGMEVHRDHRLQQWRILSLCYLDKRAFHSF